jgi:tetratricopeptide (TPR) repeat protein
MNQQTSILNITKYLGRFVHEVKANNAISLFDINKIAENVVIPIFREIFDCHELDNLNLEQANMPGIDLGDRTKRLSFQITSTAGNHKIKHTLEKFAKYKLHEHFDTLYIYILTEKQSSYADGDYLQLLENRIAFDTKQHILDYKDLLNRIDAIRDYAKIKRIEALLEEQFRDEDEKAAANINQSKNTASGQFQADGSIHIGDRKEETHYHYGDRKIPHALTPPPFLPETFIGRIEQLGDIHQKLFSGDNLLLLVNGDGGMGKTSLASKYYYQYAADYAHVAFVFSERGIADALLALAVPLGLRFDERADTMQRLEALLIEMANLQKPCLLVIDNANDTADLHANYQRLRRCPNFHLLLTTRITEFAQAATLRIEGLPDAQALDLFRKNYPLQRPDEEPLFYQIREAVGNNTLVLELLSKNLTNFNNPLRTRYALADLLADLQEKGLLQLTQTAAVRTDYQSKEGTMRHEKPEAIIAAMYDLGELNGPEKALLSNLAALPAEAIDFATLETLLPDTPDLDTHLLALAQKGWLEYNPTATTFKCSPVVQAVVKQKKADWAQDCLPMVRALAKVLKSDTLHEDNYRHSTHYARLGEAVMAALPLVDDDLGTLCQNIGNFHIATGDLGKAMRAYQKMGDIQSALLAEKPDDPDFKNGLAISYAKLGETHSSLGNLDKALSFYEKDIELSQELYAAYPQNVSFKNGLAISYSKLGETHSSLGNLDKALTFYEERSRLGQELYAAYPQNVSFKNGLAISYSKLGETHSSLGNLDKALSFFEDETKLFEELYADYPQNVSFKNGLAISYEKLGETHSSLGNLDKALTFYEERSRLGQELYAAYPQNVSFKNGLAISYYKLAETALAKEDPSAARQYFQQAEALWVALVRDAPQYVQFQRFLGQVREDLAGLE